MGKSIHNCLLVIFVLISFQNTKGQWVNTNFPSFYNGHITSIVSRKNGMLYISTASDGIFRSDDNGHSWRSVNKGLDKVNNKIDVACVAVSDQNDVYCVVSTVQNTLYHSTNNGDDWTPLYVPISMSKIRIRISSEGYLYFTDGINILFSENKGLSWKTISKGLLQPGQFIENIEIGHDNSIYAITSRHPSGPFLLSKIYVLAQPNNIWRALNSPSSVSVFQVMSNSQNQLFALLDDLYMSIDGGQSWKKISSHKGITYPTMFYIDKNDNIYLVSREEIGMQIVYRIDFSQNTGSSWSLGNSTDYIENLIVSNNEIIANSYRGIILSSDKGNTWKISNGGLPNSTRINTMSVSSGGTLIVGAQGTFAYATKDKGSTWTPLKLGWYYEPYDVTCSATNKNGMIMLGAGSNGGEGSTFSTDNGNSWNELHFDIGLPTSMTILSNNKFFATVVSVYNSSGPIVRKADGAGNVVSPVTGNGPGDYYSSLTTTENDHILAINDVHAKDGRYGSNSIKMSIDNGNSWANVYGGKWGAYPAKRVISLGNCGKGNVLAGADFGILRSNDYGYSWTVIDSAENHLKMTNFVVGKTGEIYASNANGLFESMDDGYNWKLLDSTLNVTSLVIDNDGYLFIGTQDQGVWTNAPYHQPPNGQGDSTQTQNNIPASYSLNQNFPNPFNPSTNIRYELPQSSFVTLKVYNILGEEIATLVNKNESAGIHDVNFDASRLTSGVYIYKLNAGGFVQSKKMLLLK